MRCLWYVILPYKEELLVEKHNELKYIGGKRLGIEVKQCYKFEELKQAVYNQIEFNIIVTSK